MTNGLRCITRCENPTLTERPLYARSPIFFNTPATTKIELSGHTTTPPLFDTKLPSSTLRKIIYDTPDPFPDVIEEEDIGNVEDNYVVTQV